MARRDPRRLGTRGHGRKEAAKNHSAIRRDPTKKPGGALTDGTETLPTPHRYCAVREPGVPWCDKGFRDLSVPRITLRVGKLTIGDGS
ncbi:hypothetical protein GCM10010331_03750 [Streptomyces xanthochromogenes]|nr:hypothetical protein GCM10010331_03750 [Streptomyces xanthochromogenes]